MQYELKIMPLHGQYKKLFLLMKHVDGITCGSSMLHAVSCIQFTVLCYGLIFFNFFFHFICTREAGVLLSIRLLYLFCKAI